MNEATAEPALVIALVNNMPDAALKPTERQFQTILQEAAGPINININFFFLPGIPRGEAAQLHLAKCYAPLSSLWSTRVDGLIVTGTAPCAPAFEDEPYWGGFCQLVEWAEDYGISSYWSCLAAHAAVKHSDGIERRRLDRKLSGVFECEKLEDYHLFYGIPEKWRTPHSRYNTLPAEELLSAGYKVLSQLPGGNPDIFIKKKNSLSIFAQGHLEYDRETLIYEYRRDLGKYFSGESSLLPNIPEGYFDTKTAEAVQAWIRASLLAPQEADFGFINALFRNATLANGWRPIAVQLFSNWIALLLQDAARRRLAKSFRHSRPELSAADMEWRAE